MGVTVFDLDLAFQIKKIGLAFSLIPSGFYQLYHAIKDGLWYARSPEIASGAVIKAFSWSRMVPDLIFAAGAILLFFFLVRAIWLSFIRPRPDEVNA